MKLILGSSSKPRREVLQGAGYQFEVLSPDIDEKAIRHDDLYQLPLLLAQAKASALITKVTEPAIIITADQVVICDGHLHEKPETAEEARSFYKRYAEHPAEVVSAVAVTDTKNNKTISGVDIAKVFFCPIPSEVQEKYLATGIPFKHAGGFSPEHEFVGPYVEAIEGPIDSVKGLPLKLLRGLFLEVGYNPVLG